MKQRMEEQSIVFRHPLLKLFIWRLYNKEGAAKWERRSLRIEACCGDLRPSEKPALRLGGEGGSFKAMYGYPLTGFEKAEEIPEKIVAASESSRAAPRWDLPKPNMPLSDAEREELRRRVEEKFRSAVLKNLSDLPAYIEFLEK